MWNNCYYIIVIDMSDVTISDSIDWIKTISVSIVFLYTKIIFINCNWVVTRWQWLLYIWTTWNWLLLNLDGRATWEACSGNLESWKPSQHLLIDTGKPRKTCVEIYIYIYTHTPTWVVHTKFSFWFHVTFAIISAQKNVSSYDICVYEGTHQICRAISMLLDSEV
jgi:hypothetical protein